MAKLTPPISVDSDKKTGAEQELRKSREKLDLALRSADMGAWELDLAEQRRYFDAQVCRILGIDPGRFAGTAEEFYAAVHPDDRQAIKNALEKTIRTGVPYEKEYRAVWPDGSIHHIATRGRLVSDGDGAQRVYGIIWDVTDRKRAEKELKDSEHRYRQLVQSSPDAIIVHRNGDFLYANAAALALYGAAALWQLKERNLLDLVHQDDRDMVLERMRQLERGERVPLKEMRVITLDGREIHVEAYASRVTYGKDKAIQVIIRDITDRKQVEESLRKSETSLKRAQQISHLGSWELDLVENRLTWSDEVYRIFGLQPQEFGATYEAFLEGVHPDDRAAVDAAYSGSVRDGLDSYEIEHRVVRKGTGEIRHVQEKCQHVRDAQGRIVQSLGMVLDITERKAAQEALVESEHRYRGIVETAEEGIATHEPDGTITYVNQRMAIMLSYSREEIIGMSSLDFVEDKEKESVIRARESVKDQGSFSKEWRLRRKDGSTLWTLSNVSPRRDGTGNFIGYLAMHTDITEVKRAEEELRQLNANLERVVEERTADATLLATQLRELASELTLAEQRERQRIAKVLHDHIQQLLVAAKLQAAALVSRQQNEDLKSSVRLVSDLIDETISASRNLTADLIPPVLYDAGFGPALQWLARNFLDKHGLQVDVRFSPTGEPQSHDVRVFMFDAVREVLFNVVKHADVNVAHVDCFRGSDGRVQVVVRDEGKGFDPVRLQTRETSQGFGLFSIQQRLKHIGGRLEADSTPGQGTRITIVGPPPPKIQQLPLKVAEPYKHTDTTEKDSNTNKIRVVLADDHHIIRQGLAGLLRMEPDIEIVAEASNGAQAINLARTHHPDVVVMDVSMPVLNGVEATMEIRRDMPDIKVIGLSMHEEGELSSAIRQAGAVAYVTKGGAPESLVAAIRKAVGGK
jgi:PAS domain S-box-containing protein